jgi:hypothetical protein
VFGNPLSAGLAHPLKPHPVILPDWFLGYYRNPRKAANHPGPFDISVWVSLEQLAKATADEDQEPPAWLVMGLTVF